MKKSFPILAIVLVATVFVAGVVALFLLRFEAGDVYPPYSSLRADPLGTMALCESLAKLPGLEVRRDMTDANKLPEERSVAYLHLAAEVSEWRGMPDDVFDEVGKYLARGGRLVITMRPVTGWEFWPSVPPTTITATNVSGTNSPATYPSRARKSTGRKSGSPRPGAVVPEGSLAKRWGVDFGREKLLQGADDVYQPARVVNQTDLPLPDSLAWHTILVLTNLDSTWRTIYARGKNPVVAERAFGRGSIVMATDSYFLSNQALWKDRQPRLLAWLIGPVEHVVFDEAHLGVSESPGVATLMRKYRLSGLIGALGLLAGLFIWKNSFSLVPPHAGGARSPYVPGKDATAGFVNLLRRNIPPRQVLEVCFEQWTRSLLNRANYRIAAVDQAQTIMERERARPPTARTPVQAYREISEALKSPGKQHATRNPPSESRLQSTTKPDTTA